MDIYNTTHQLRENPTEMYYISKYISEHENTNPKIIRGVVELLVNDYLQNESEENIVSVFEFLSSYENEDVDWSDAVEVNDLLEKYF